MTNYNNKKVIVRGIQSGEVIRQLADELGVEC